MNPLLLCALVAVAQAPSQRPAAPAPPAPPARDTIYVVVPPTTTVQTLTAAGRGRANVEAFSSIAQVVIGVGLLVFAAVQVWHQIRQARDRQRVAYTALFAEYWRIVALDVELKDQDLVARTQVGTFDAGLLRPQDWGTIIQLMGEVSSATAAFGGWAYARLNAASSRGYEITSVARHPDASRSNLRELETQCKEALHQAVQLLEDAFKAAPTWLAKHEFTVVDAISPMGKRVQDMLLGERKKLAGSRHEPRLGFVGRRIGNGLARVARWFNPAA